ncbi:MAG: 50S ribosomal protein L4 [Parcubacteria group bacterium GW2011_GWC1_38_17]|nr:MAG: 50S ribosomal protein L4 [Parcubacteria group bacterium GW2011_GWC2_36_17]KKQ40115.1 MAG: 50S ribosomal protein L4 [Candidatus Moranbacteria bacterium GW2011_GWF2_37_7]KKQ43576.1 MAG: 50S ribosomal protein L4 [Parcubacteria group bacterium GW2011_GWE2_37_8]KKQ58917.1 MAG: 50S ribosomal protein L4 [Parcubacteria group bacterium GW2011_GWC1_38_17]
MEYPVYNLKGENVGAMELPQDIFGVKLNPDLLHQVVVSLQSSARHPIAHTKTRGEVRGGGKKPWKQKGTGRARHGSIRSPIWKGGGVTFGPRNERNFKKKINKKMKRKALLMAFSSKVKDNQLVIFEDLKMKEPKTKIMASVISKILNMPKPKVLFVLNPENRNAWLTSRNCGGSKLTSVNDLNVVDILNKKFIITSKEEIQLMKKNLIK